MTRLTPTYANNSRAARWSRAVLFFVMDYVVGSVPETGHPFREMAIVMARILMIEMGLYHFIKLAMGVL